MALVDFVSEHASSWTRGIALAVLADIAYLVDDDVRRARFAAVGAVEVLSLDCSDDGISGLNASILRKDRDLIIAIRGSQEVLDWINNARMRKGRLEGALVHRGFRASARRLLSGLEGHGSLFGNYDKIWFTGHSLGGAVAQITGFALANRGLEVANVTTFGAPRAGGPLRWRNKVKDLGLDSRFERWVNQRDIVPRIPFAVPGVSPRNWAWVHVGKLNLMSTEGTTSLDDDTLLPPTGRTAQAFNDHTLNGMFHDSSGYIRNMLLRIPSDELAMLTAKSGISLQASLRDFNRVHSESSGSLHDLIDQVDLDQNDRTPTLGQLGISCLSL